MIQSLRVFSSSINPSVSSPSVEAVGVETVLLLKILKAVAHFSLFTILFSLKFVSLPSETKYYYYEHND